MTNSKKTIALISGANAGIGLAVATQLAQKHNYHVIIGSRNEAAGKEAAASIAEGGFAASSVQLDINSDASIAAAVSRLEREFGYIDVLINNAGILIDYIPGQTDQYKDLGMRERFQQTFDTNVSGTACLTEACLPLLRKADLARLIFVSSSMASLELATRKDTFWYAMDYRVYDCSKAALNMLAINYARILDGTGALVNVVSPGLVKTKLTAFHDYGTSTEVGAQRIVELATAEKGSAHLMFTSQEGSIPW